MIACNRWAQTLRVLNLSFCKGEKRAAWCHRNGVLGREFRWTSNSQEELDRLWIGLLQPHRAPLVYFSRLSPAPAGIAVYNFKEQRSSGLRSLSCLDGLKRFSKLKAKWSKEKMILHTYLHIEQVLLRFQRSKKKKVSSSKWNIWYLMLLVEN